MLNLKDLLNRVYVNKEVVRFEVNVEDEDKSPLDPAKRLFTAFFTRDAKDKLLWTIQVVLPRTAENDSQVYAITFRVPKASLSLQVVAGMGLTYFSAKLQDEMAQKSTYVYEIANLVKVQ